MNDERIMKVLDDERISEGRDDEGIMKVGMMKD